MLWTPWVEMYHFMHSGWKEIFILREFISEIKLTLYRACNLLMYHIVDSFSYANNVTDYRYAAKNRIMNYFIKLFHLLFVLNCPLNYKYDLKTRGASVRKACI